MRSPYTTHVTRKMSSPLVFDTVCPLENLGNSQASETGYANKRLRIIFLFFSYVSHKRHAAPRSTHR